MQQPVENGGGDENRGLQRRGRGSHTRSLDHRVLPPRCVAGCDTFAFCQTLDAKSARDALLIPESEFRDKPYRVPPFRQDGRATPGPINRQKDTKGNDERVVL
jgi:hypothetical protein